MSVPYYAHALVLPDDTLTQFTNPNVSYGIQPLIAYAAGDYAPIYSGGITANPGLTLPTRQLRKVLSLVSPALQPARGRTVLYNASIAASDLLYRRGQEFAMREDLTSLTHEILRFNRSLLIWDSLSAQQGTVAECTIQLVPTYDNVNLPLTQHAGSIPAITGADEQFTLGPIHINGTAYDGLQRAAWTNNVRPETIMHNGIPFVIWASGMTYEPRVSVTLRDASLHRLVGPTGLAVTSLTQYFRRLQQSDLTYDDAAPQHIRLSATLGTGWATQLDAQGRVSIQFNMIRATPVTEPFSITVDTPITGP